MFFFAVLVIGIISLSQIPVELTPEVEYPKLSITVNWSGVSAEVMEAQVTSVIESAMAGIEGVKKISSQSSSGYSKIDLEFHENTDMPFSRMEILEKISSVKDELPFGVSSPRLSDYVPDDLADLQGFLTYSVSAQVSAGQIQKTVNDEMLYPLLSVPGVRDVKIRGGRELSVNISIDQKKMNALRIFSNELNDAISEIEILGPIGAVYSGDHKVHLFLNNKVNDLGIIRNQPVKVLADGTIIRISDFCSVDYDFAEATSYYRLNGKETVTITIDKKRGANTIETAGLLKDKIKDLSDILPTGYIVKKEVDKSEKMKNELDELFSGAFYSLLFIILILFIIYRNLKHSFVIIISIVFSLLLSFILFNMFNMSLNVLTIAAFVLGFGFMVDNSIVVVDFIEQHPVDNNLKKLAVILNKIFPAVFASTITTIAVFIPIIFMSGDLKLYFEQFAKGIVFTLTASLIASFTVVPPLYFRMIKRKEIVVTKDGFIKKIYSHILTILFRFKKSAITFIILINGLPVWLLPNRIETPVFGDLYNFVFASSVYDDIKPYVNYAFGGSLNLFFNHLDRGRLWNYGSETKINLRIELPNGNHIERINKICQGFEEEILKYKGNFDFISANVYSDEIALITINFDKEQAKTAFPYVLKNYLTSYANHIGGISVAVSGFGPGFYNGLSSASTSNSVEIKGFNYDKVKELALEFKSIIENNSRVTNIDIDKGYYYGAKDSYEIIGKIKRNLLAEKGINVIDLIDEMSSVVSGNFSYNKFLIDNDEVPFVIKYSNYKNLQLNNLENTIIQLSNGSKIKFKDVVEFKEKKVLSRIIREDQQYLRIVSFNYKGPYRYANKLIENSIKQINVPEGYLIKERIQYLLMQQEEEMNIALMLLIALLLIFMITGALFESLKKPLLIMTAIPFAAVGAILLFYFGDFTFDRGAYAGLLLLVGLSVNNSILLVDYLNKFNTNAGFKQITELSYKRIKPIFTTTLTTIAAILPLLIITDSDFWQSLGLAILGGIVISALLVILFVPLLFVNLNHKEKF